MKCRSVACLWSDAPPSHRITSTAVLTQPATLYTGGSDGSIIWWNISSSESITEVKPIAMLCGHAAPIADLAVCDPTAVSGNGNTAGCLKNDEVNSFRGCGALISACSDGVLCVWSRSSGHCRRRRKLPPWVGSPSVLCTLPSEPRYVSVGCSFVDNHSLDAIEGVEAFVDADSQNRKPSKCTVVIVDTYTLTIVQTVFHGNLSIGPFKFMGVVQLEENESLLMADSSGRLQLVPVSEDPHKDGEGAPGTGKSSLTLINVLTEGEMAVSVITHQNIVALLSKHRCVFWLSSHGEAIGEISFVENSFIPGDQSPGSHVKGAMFICSWNTSTAEKDQDDVTSEKFVVWNDSGSIVMYDISYINGEFTCKILGEVVSGSNQGNGKSQFCFVQLRQHLLCVESSCSDSEEPLRWKPNIRVWSLFQENDDNRELQIPCKMLGEGPCFADWFSNSCLDLEIENSSKRGNSQLGSPCTSSYDVKRNACKEGRIVSSSMVISGNMYAPYAVVYGFSSGEIEIVKFELLHGLDSPAASPRLDTDSFVSKQIFSGHTGAVLCFAAHQMLGASKGWSFSHVLISGSMDGTVRVWDLDRGNVIMVMHHHVAPVRQIILAPSRTDRPWSDCFLSVGDDSCVALSSLETLRVERMFPGHPGYPAKVVWDGTRGYIACLCRSRSRMSDPIDALHIWDVKTGARERVLHGTASHSMFNYFCTGISVKSSSGTVLNGDTSVSSLLFPVDEEKSPFYLKNYERAASSSTTSKPSTSQANTRQTNSLEPSSHQSNTFPPIKCTCPFPGISALIFDLSSLAISSQAHDDSNKQEAAKERNDISTTHHETSNGKSPVEQVAADSAEVIHMDKAVEEYLIRFSLSFLHLWGIDSELDQVLMTQMKLKRPENFIVSSGLQGDKGSLTLAFPGLNAILELWKSSSEFSALRSMMMVSLAQHMISLTQSTAPSSSALATFYTRNLLEKYPDLKPPLLQLLVTFWQDRSEQVRMAARSVFHYAASLAIPLPLCSDHASEHAKLVRSLSGIGEPEYQTQNTEENPSENLAAEQVQEAQRGSQAEESELLTWLESFEMQDWISCVGGMSQDAMASHIIVAAALSIWYPSLVKPSLPMLVVHRLINLVMAMNEKYSSTAAELLAEGMQTTWKQWIGPDIPRIVSDIFFQIECVSGSAGEHKYVPPTSIKKTLVEVLLPSLAMVDVLGFLNIIESQIWSTASDSPVHIVSLCTLLRIVRGSPRNLVLHLDKVVNFVIQTMDPSNSVMRRSCQQTSMATLREVVRVFPMVALNDSGTRLAIGDAVAEINNASIRIYDMQSVTKIKILDASGPPGLPSLLGGASESAVTTAISALSFSPDGEGLVAFSENGLMIRWWTLGSVWWEKLSRSLTPVQCTKLIFVPPWEGFSSNIFRSSVISSITGHKQERDLLENSKNISQADRVKQVVHHLDLSYRLEWVGERKIRLTRHGVELGTFPL